MRHSRDIEHVHRTPSASHLPVRSSHPQESPSLKHATRRPFSFPAFSLANATNLETPSCRHALLQISASTTTGLPTEELTSRYRRKKKIPQPPKTTSCRASTKPASRLRFPSQLRTPSSPLGSTPRTPFGSHAPLLQPSTVLSQMEAASCRSIPKPVSQRCSDRASSSFPRVPPRSARGRVEQSQSRRRRTSKRKPAAPTAKDPRQLQPTTTAAVALQASHLVVQVRWWSTSLGTFTTCTHRWRRRRTQGRRWRSSARAKSNVRASTAALRSTSAAADGKRTSGSRTRASRCTSGDTRKRNTPPKRTTSLR